MANERWIGAGPEPAYGTRDLLEAVTAAATLTADRNVSGPSKIQVIVAAGTTGSGTVTIPVTINGATVSLVYTFAANGTISVPDTYSAAPTITAIDTSAGAIATANLADESAKPTVQIECIPIEYWDFMEESIEPDNTVADDADTANEPWVTEHTPTNLIVAGNILVHMTAANLGIFLKSLLGQVTTTPKNGINLDTGNTIATVNKTGSITGAPKRLKITVNSITGTGTLTLNGTVNGVADTDAISITGTGDFYSLLAFDTLDAAPSYAHAGYSALGWDIDQVDSLEHAFTTARTNNSMLFDIAKDGIYVGVVDGVKMKSCKFAFVNAKYTDLTVSTIAKDFRKASIPATDPSSLIVSRRPFVFSNGTVTFDSTTNAEIRGGTLTLNCGYDEADFVMDGNRQRKSLRLETAMVDLSLSMQLENSEFLEKFFGTDNDTQPQDTLTDIDIQITLTSPELIFVLGDAYKLVIDIPTDVIKTYGDTQKGRTRPVFNATFSIREGSSGYPIRFLLTNDVAGY